MKKTFARKKSAFSLIELSIVLIIIGLLIAGVTGGASLIKSSQLRAAAGEGRAWATAVNGFYTQFNALPGDYGTAIAGSSGGDQDGTIEYFNNNTGSPSGAAANEGRAAWMQMRGANILDTTVVSVATITTTNSSTIAGISTFGSLAPASKIQGAGWDFDYNTTSLQNVVVLTAATGTLASTSNTLVNGTVISTGAITPPDALSIDTKIDDGAASTGKIRGVNTSGTVCNNGATYTTATTTKACVISYQIDVNS